MRPALSTLFAAVLCACGASPNASPSGPGPCDAAEASLRRRVGPEFGAVVARHELPMPARKDAEGDPVPAPSGCALVYTLVGEEMPGEVAGESGDSSADHQLAIALPGTGGQALTLVEPSKDSPGAVMVEASTRDITANGQQELVVVENTGFGADSYKGLRVFDYGRGDGVPHEVFGERLVITTPEGLTLIPAWKTGSVGDRRAILMDGAGTIRVYTWDGATRRFTFDEAETAKRAPKPEPEEKPAEAESEPVGGEKGEAAAEEKAEPKKEAPKKEKKPITLEGLGL